jgi:hypothetical protein
MAWGLDAFNINAGNKTLSSNLSKMTQSVAASVLNDQSSKVSFTTVATTNLFQRLTSLNDNFDCGNGVANIDINMNATTRATVFAKIDVTQKANFTNEIANKLIEYAQQNAKSSGGDAANAISAVRLGDVGIGNKVEAKNATYQNTQIRNNLKTVISQAVSDFVDASQKIFQDGDVSGLKVRAGAGCNIKFGETAGIDLQVTSLANSLQDAIVTNVLKNDVSQTSKQDASATQGSGGSGGGGGFGALLPIIGIIVGVVVLLAVGIAVFMYIRSRGKNTNPAASAAAPMQKASV